jgi:outer membrane protein TolC
MRKYKIACFMMMLHVGVFGQSVEELIMQAKEYNPGLKAMQLDYQSALQKADQVNDWPDPTVNVGIGVLPVETRLGAQRFKIGVSQMIPWKGLLDAKSNVAGAMAEVQAYEDDIKEIDIEYAIRTAYSTIQFLEAKKEIISKRLEVLDALEEMSKSAVRSGKGKLSNVLFTERKREVLEADLTLLDKKIEQPSIMINRWTGQELDRQIEVTPYAEVLYSEAEIIDYANNYHPQYKTLKNARSVSDAKIDLVEYESKPKIGVGLDYAYIDARNDVEIPGNGRDILMPMGSISIPLHKGRYSAIKQEETIKQQAIDQKIEEIRDMYTAEIKLAYSTIEYSDDVIRKYESLKEITSETLKLMRTEYAAEGTRFEELLRLEMELIDYDLEILKAQYERRLAQAILLKYK